MTNPTVRREICGTKQGFIRHKELREHRCTPCREAYRAAPPRLTVEELIHEIEWMMGLGQGSGYILKAIDYTGREKQLRDRLAKNGRVELFNRLLCIDNAQAAA